MTIGEFALAVVLACGMDPESAKEITPEEEKCIMAYVECVVDKNPYMNEGPSLLKAFKECDEAYKNARKDKNN